MLIQLTYSNAKNKKKGGGVMMYIEKKTAAHIFSRAIFLVCNNKWISRGEYYKQSIS